MNFKDVTIKEKTYRIGEYTPKVGGYITSQLLPLVITHLPKPDENGKVGISMAVFFQILPDIPEAVYYKIVDYSLSVCCEYNTEHLPVPVIMPDGKWVVKHLESDIVGVMALTVAVLMHNLQPFFSDGGLQTILKVTQDLSL